MTDTADKRSIDACLICDSDRLRELRRYEKDYLVACQECSFVFSGLRPTQSELDRVYGAYSREAVRTEETIRKMQAMATQLKELSQARRVIDIGCGDGEFLLSFLHLGCEAYGTEYDSRTEEVCRSKGIIMLPGGLLPRPEHGAAPGTFDLAIFTEVIEHINNPRKVINNISTLLRKGGLLYITTPNFASLERMAIGPRWGMICYPEHIAFYSPRTLNALLEASGYERVFLRTENVSVFRILEFINSRKDEAGAAAREGAEKISAAAQRAAKRNPLLRLAKNMVNALLDATGTGSSLVAVYRRR